MSLANDPCRSDVFPLVLIAVAVHAIRTFLSGLLDEEDGDEDGTADAAAHTAVRRQSDALDAPSVFASAAAIEMDQSPSTTRQVLHAAATAATTRSGCAT